MCYCITHWSIHPSMKKHSRNSSVHSMQDNRCAEVSTFTMRGQEGPLLGIADYLSRVSYDSEQFSVRWSRLARNWLYICINTNIYAYIGGDLLALTLAADQKWLRRHIYCCCCCYDADEIRVRRSCASLDVCLPQRLTTNHRPYHLFRTNRISRGTGNNRSDVSYVQLLQVCGLQVY